MGAAQGWFDDAEEVPKGLAVLLQAAIGTGGGECGGEASGGAHAVRNQGLCHVKKGGAAVFGEAELLRCLNRGGCKAVEGAADFINGSGGCGWSR